MRLANIVQRVSNENLEAASPETGEPNETVTDTENQDEVAEQEALDKVNEDTQTVANSQAELLNAQEESEKAVSIATSLDELEVNTQKIIDDNSGVLSVPAATLVQASMESIMKCLGIDYSPVVSTEALRGTYSKKAATEATLESFKDNIKKAFDAVVAAIKKTATAVFGLIASIFNSKGAIISVLKSNLSKLKAFEKDKATVKTPQIYGSFVNQLTIQLDADKKFYPDQVLDNAERLPKLYLTMADTIKDLRDRGSVPVGIETSIAKQLESLFGFDTRTIKTADDKTVTVYGHFVDDSGIFVSDTGLGLQVFHGNKQLSELLPIDTPSLGEAIGLTERAISMLTKMGEAEKQLDTIKSLVLGMLRSIENEYNRLRGAMGSEDHEKRTQVFKKAQELHKVLNGSIARIPMLTVKIGKAIASLTSAVCLAYT